MKKSMMLVLVALFSLNAYAKLNAVEMTKETAENQVRRLLEPVLDKYCHDECKLMSVSASVDVAAPDEVAPGFDDVDSSKSNDLAPSSARVKILVNEKIGPVTRQKLLDLAQQYLDTLDFPVKIDTQLASFPEPIESANKVADLRDQITKKFKTSLNEIFQQFCPTQCLLADYNIETEAVNNEETQYGKTGEYFQDGDVALRIKNISASILMDETLTQEERNNILEMAKLKTNDIKGVELSSKAMKFPHPTDFASRKGDANTGGVGVNGTNNSLSSTDNKTETNRSIASTSATASNNESKNIKESNSVQNTQQATSKELSNNTENNTKQEHFERYEKLERVENGDAVQAELKKFQTYGLIFACSVFSLLIFLVMASFRSKSTHEITNRSRRGLTGDPSGTDPHSGRTLTDSPHSTSDWAVITGRRYEIERLAEELTTVFAQNPKVAKQVFSRVLTEEGVETTAEYIEIFGEGIVVDMLRDPSLQTDLGELMEYYAKNTIELSDEEKLELLRKLHNRTVAGKLSVLGNRSSNLFDFIAEMDGLQILEMIRTESLTVKSIIITQCDPQKRAIIYSHLDNDMRMSILAELSRIDHLPRDFIYNIAAAMKRKRRENPRLNTEALPGSEVLVSLLERTAPEMQRNVVRNLEASNPDSARTVKGKLVSIETLRFLRDGQLLEVVLSLKNDELLQFLKGASNPIRGTIFAKAPKDLTTELEEQLAQIPSVSRETYNAVERKVLNRMKIMANDGLINLVETNERMFAEANDTPAFVEGGLAPMNGDGATQVGQIKKVAGW